jgi:phage-related protein
MIFYDGVSIESVAPVMIEDIKVSPIKYNPVARQRAVRFGADFVRMGGGERKVVLTFAILDKSQVTRQEAFLALSKWAKTDAEYKLELPEDPARYLMCVCTGKPEPSTRAWWENKLRLTFSCYDNPFWTAKQEKTVAVNTQFNVLGSAPPLMRVERAATSDSNVTLSNGTQTITLTTLPTGYIIFDLNRQTIQADGASIMQYYSPSSSFIIPKTGVQTITATGDLQYSVVKYRERWE